MISPADGWYTDLNNIVLIGMPGTGKSTVGALLAERLNYSLIDTDTLLARQNGMSLPHLLEQQGIETFLKLESQVGEQLVCEHTVIATGGSMVFSQTAMRNLMAHNVVVWLDTALSELERRIAFSGDRGIAAAKGTTIDKLDAMRRPLYKRYADMRVRSEGTPEEVTDRILEALAHHGYII